MRWLVCGRVVLTAGRAAPAAGAGWCSMPAVVSWVCGRVLLALRWAAPVAVSWAGEWVLRAVRSAAGWACERVAGGRLCD